MTTKNPFPGMNPFFEQQWRDAHTSLITYLRDALQERLPPYRVQQASDVAAGDWTDYLADAVPPVNLPLTNRTGFLRVVGH